ncbi:AAA family ATPase [Azospirillum sp. B21]|uniref:AAA family ATPase n=1 Tax=Azospirillum sp. B21 TaxID=2607496 RepID=UPI0011EBE1EC|nr:AAA family ATPase [Azospirillum sp. B21]KAA0574388.1 AAA family ATPase [Azospirillum sp. B21]
MRGEGMKAFRERRELTQPDFALWLNERLQRRYDRSKISRWESNSEKIPEQVARFLLQELAGPEVDHGPALTLVFANRKGGVGKTVSSVNVAAGLAQRGCSVLFVDSDPQANATMHFGLNPIHQDKINQTLYTPLRAAMLDSPGAATLAECTVQTGEGSLHVVPSGMRLGDAETELLGKPGSDFTLREILTDARRTYDFIVIDTPPHFGALTINALTAGDGIIVPCQTEAFSVTGVEFLLKNIDAIQRRSNPRLSVIGLLPTMYDHRLVQDRASLEDMHRIFGKMLRIFPPMPRATVYAQAAAAGRTVAEALPDAPGMAVYEEVVAAVVEKRNQMTEAANVVA